MSNKDDNLIKYTLRDDYAVLEKYHTDEKRVVIPDEIDGRPVKYIAPEAFEFNFSIEYVELPSELKTIGDDAFLDSSLKTIRMSSAEHIGKNAFRNTNLETVNLPANLKTIGDGAFYETPLKSLKIDPNNEYFSVIDGVLYNKDITSLIIFPSNKYGNKKFDYKLPETTKEIGNYVFNNTAIRRIEIPCDLHTISDYAFYGCFALEELVLPEELRSIGSYAFGFSGLSQVMIPASTALIGKKAFCNCPLKRIDVDPDNPSYRSIDGVLLNKEATELIQYPAGDMERTTYELPPSVRRIHNIAFEKSHLNEVVFNEGLYSIGIRAFESSALTRVSLPSTLTELDNYVFLNCSNLVTLEASSNLKKIGIGVLNHCSSLKNLKVNASNLEEWQKQVPEGFTGIRTE